VHLDDQKDLIVENVVEITNTTSPTSSSETLSSISSTIFISKATQDDSTNGYSSSDSGIDISTSKKESTNLPTPIKIIITPPTSDTATLSSTPFTSSSTYTPSMLSFSSTSTSTSTSTYDSTRLMPPSPSSHTHRAVRPTESPAIKLWLISRMNRKADTVPAKLVRRMMEMYDIREDELDPRMVAKLRSTGGEEFDDEGVAMSLDFLGGMEGGQFAGRGPVRPTITPIHAQFTSTTVPRTKNAGSQVRKNTDAGKNPRAWKVVQDASKQSQTQSYDFPPYSSALHMQSAAASSQGLGQRSGAVNGNALTPILEGDGNVSGEEEVRRRGKGKREGRPKGDGKGRRSSMFVSLFGEKAEMAKIRLEKKKEQEREREREDSI
jgi:hypothetical protein